MITKKEVTFFLNADSLAIIIGNEYKGIPTILIDVETDTAKFNSYVHPAAMGTSTVINFNRRNMRERGIEKGTKADIVIKKVKI